MDILLLTLTVGYNMHYGYPLTAYAENVVILVQNYIIFYLSWQYKRVASNNFFVGSGIGLVVLFLFLTGRMPEEVYLYNQMLVAFLSRLPLNQSHGLKVPSDSRELHQQVNRRAISDNFPAGMCRQLR